MIYSGIRGFRQLVTLLLQATESTKSIDAQLSLSLSLLSFLFRLESSLPGGSSHLI